MTIARTKNGEVWSSIYPIAPCPICEEPIELRAIPHFARDAAGRLKLRNGEHYAAWIEVDPCPNCEHCEAWTSAERAAMAEQARQHYAAIDGDTRTKYRMPDPLEDPAMAYAIRHRVHKAPGPR